MKKQLLLFMMMLLPVLASADDSGTCGNGVTYTFVEETGTLTISGSGNMKDYGYVKDGYYMTTRTPWYNYRQNIRTVIIEKGVTTVGAESFNGCNSLTSIDISEDIITIGRSAFSNCSSLYSITLPANLKNIESYAFLGCNKLTKLEIPDNTIQIGACSFKNCSDLSIVKIGSSVNTIGKNAFWGCTNLTTIRMSKDLKYIGDDAFYDCNSINSVYIEDISNWCNIEFSFSIETRNYYSNPLKYGAHIFINDEEVTDLIIPEGTTSISDCAFMGCKGLRSVRIPTTMKSIGKWVFSDISLDAIYISDLKKWCQIDFKGPFAKHLYLDNELITNLNIPEDITSIGAYAFWGCEDIKNITLPQNLEKIGYGAFYNCSGITSITIPDNVTTIDKSAFGGCYNLVSIKIGKKLTSLSSNLFSDCWNIKTIDIPDNVEIICDSVFFTHNSVQRLDIVRLGKNIKKIGKFSFTMRLGDFYCYPENVPEIDKETFSNTISNATLHVPVKSIDSYKANSYWKQFGTIVGIVSKYKLEYIVDGAEYKSYEVEYGATITPEPAPTKEGYTFSGWSEIPETMPAHDVTVTGTFSINKYKLTYTVDGTEYKTYDIEYGATITPEAAPTKEGYTFSGWSEIPTTMPAHDVTVTGTFTKEETVTVTANSYTRLYGEANPTFEYTVSGGTLTGTPSTTCSATATSAVGEYDIVVSKGSVTNYNVTFVNGKLTVAKSPLTITAKSYTIKQGDALPAFEAEYSGFKNDETNSVLSTQPTISTTATSASEPGTYEITVSGASATNYDISYVKGTLTITKADEVVVTANSYTRLYGEANPTFEYTTSGATLTGTPSISCEATATSPVGEYDIVVSKGSITNYNVTLVNGKLTIAKAPLTIKAKNYTIKQGESLPTFEAEYSGFKNNETASVLSAQPTITTSATSASAPGTYDIIVSGASATNYNISYVKGTLTISAVEVDPVTETETTTFSETVNENTDLSNTIIGNTYFTVNAENGDGYDATEQAIVLNSTTTAEQMDAVQNAEVGDATMQANYSGIIFEVPAGNGTITVEAKTLGSHVLNVQIGNGEPTKITKLERGTVDVPYNVTVPTYVYLYASTSGANGAPKRAAAANSVLLYSYKVDVLVNGISVVTYGDMENAKWYTTDGIQLQGKPTKKGLYIVNGRKVVVK